MTMWLSPNGRVFLCFWIFGLVNNVLYVVILSAAIDLVGPQAPKAIVLLADVLPAFFVKVTAPFFMHIIPYNLRIASLIVLSFIGMIIIAYSNSVVFRLGGIVLASLSSGIGEISFLQLTHFYEGWALPGFSSGTGAAGLVGSFAFLVLTTWMGLSTKTALIIFSVIPFTFWGAFGFLLPASDTSLTTKYHSLNPELGDEEQVAPDQIVDSAGMMVTDSVLSVKSIQATLQRLRPLVIPYMMPLMTVYIAEYIINQGISPTLLFPIEEMPFSRYRDAYVTYGTLYQRKLQNICGEYKF